MTRSGRKRIIVMWLALHIRLTSRPNIQVTMLPKIFWSSQKLSKKWHVFAVLPSNFQDQTRKQMAMWPKVFGKSQKTFLNIMHSSTLVREWIPWTQRYWNFDWKETCLNIEVHKEDACAKSKSYPRLCDGDRG